LNTQPRVNMPPRASPPPHATGDREQRRRVRRSALLWGLVALGVYTGFIVRSVLHSAR
jgi:hypothetical protein